MYTLPSPHLVNYAVHLNKYCNPKQLFNSLHENPFVVMKYSGSHKSYSRDNLLALPPILRVIAENTEIKCYIEIKIKIDLIYMHIRI